MKTIGKLLPNNKVELEFYGQGLIYKNTDAYEKQSEEICYVPEYGADDFGNITHGYTFRDFQRIASEYVENNVDVQIYLNSEGYSEEVIADELFSSVDWQSPETLVSEWEDRLAWTR